MNLLDSDPKGAHIHHSSPSRPVNHHVSLLTLTNEARTSFFCDQRVQNYIHCSCLTRLNTLQDFTDGLSILYNKELVVNNLYMTVFHPAHGRSYQA